MQTACSDAFNLFMTDKFLWSISLAVQARFQPSLYSKCLSKCSQNQTLLRIKHNPSHDCTLPNVLTVTEWLISRSLHLSLQPSQSNSLNAARDGDYDVSTRVLTVHLIEIQFTISSIKCQFFPLHDKNAHIQHLQHCDLTPANHLITEKGTSIYWHSQLILLATICSEAAYCVITAKTRGDKDILPLSVETLVIWNWYYCW